MKQINDALPKGTVLKGNTYQYIIDRVLGQGSFGITYLATVDTQNELGDLRTFVCVKEFFMHEENEREGLSVSSGSKKGLFVKYRHKFVNEAKRLGELHHPNIVRVIESFEANNTVYYSMQLIEGGSLDDLITKRGRLGEKETLRIADKIAQALEYMHQWNMLHLDLKPKNVMMHRGNPVLIDFGLSKQYDEDGNPETSTTIGGGTPGYSPIEQTNYTDEPHKELPVTMDIYALGATMFKMLTGERPPLASDIVNDGLPVEKLKENGVSEETIQLVSQMMDSKRKQRPQSLYDVRHLIRDILKKLPDEETVVDENTNVGEDTKIENESQSAMPVPAKIDTPPIAHKVEESNNPRFLGEQKPEPPESPKPVLVNPIAKKKQKKLSVKSWILIGVGVIALIGIIGIILSSINRNGNGGGKTDSTANIHMTPVQTVEDEQVDIQTPEPSRLSYITSTGEITYEGHRYKMVDVPGDTFTMGSSEHDSEANSDEKPAHQVTLSSFQLGATEVPQWLWEAVMGDNPSICKGENLPVEAVSYNDCEIFIGKLNNMTGQDFRLPTEAEWEYAAGGGNSGRTKYAGTNSESSLGDYAWYCDNSGNKTHEVGTKLPNRLRLYDMSGNVWEWCSDWYDSKYYKESPYNDPTGPSTERSYRVQRCGGWSTDADGCRVAYRTSNALSYRSKYLGLRLAR